MEKMLLKLARQLDELDEASLMALWSKYATQTSRFEPTRRWEEACLVFSLIQAKRWKNQLFNYSWKQYTATAPKVSQKPETAKFSLEPETTTPAKNSCKILSFSKQHENNSDNIKK